MKKSQIQETLKNTNDLESLKMFVKSISSSPEPESDADVFFGFNPKDPYAKVKQLKQKLKNNDTNH